MLLQSISNLQLGVRSLKHCYVIWSSILLILDYPSTSQHSQWRLRLKLLLFFDHWGLIVFMITVLLFLRWFLLTQRLCVCLGYRNWELFSCRVMLVLVSVGSFGKINWRVGLVRRINSWRDMSLSNLGALTNNATYYSDMSRGGSVGTKVSTRFQSNRFFILFPFLTL